MKVLTEAHKRQADHNHNFHELCCKEFPEHFYDWKITILFYCGLHKIKCYYCGKGIDIGTTHQAIESNINPDRPGAPYPVNRDCWRNYKALFRYSHTARYDGITDPKTFEKMQKTNHQHCLLHLANVDKYINSKTAKN